MAARGSYRSGSQDALPPPPPVVPSNVVPELSEAGPSKREATRLPIARRGLGSKGERKSLLTNHFSVNITPTDDYFFHYSVSLYENDRPIPAKGIGRKAIDKVQQIHGSELAGKYFAYDGEKSLFTIGPLPQNKIELPVMLEDISSNRSSVNPDGSGSPQESDHKRLRRPYQTKTFKVVINFSAKIPMQAIADALRGQESENSQEALRVLNIVLRQHAAKQGCLLVRQSFFRNEPKNVVDLGGGVLGCRGFHASFRPTQCGLSLNVDVSTTLTIQPGHVVDFLIFNQNVKDPSSLDWATAKRMLKNLRITVSPSNQEYRITGLSEKPCKEQTFQLKQRRGESGDEAEQPLEITVYDYFVNHRQIKLKYSGDFPCINVGKPKRPTYIPLELCTLISLQRYTKALSILQRASLVEKSRQKPQERMIFLSNALKTSEYDSEPMLRSCGISISGNFTQVEGRVLPAPMLKVGNGENLSPRNGRWNFNNKELVEPSKILKWAVVNFSAHCNVDGLVQGLMKCATQKGITIEAPFDVFVESPQFRRAPPMVRVEKLFEELKSRLPGEPQFLLCLLPEKKNSEIYGPWKQKNLAEFGIVTQCIAPQRVTDQYLTNVLLKINAKLGGLNSLLAVERSKSIPLVSEVPTIILGMDVSHGSPGQSDVPSIAAVVSSRQWPSISRYRASVRTQSPKLEMIDSLFKRVSDNKDEGVMRELLLDFYTSSGKRKPELIIIFRDGVSESQFHQVLNVELDQIIEACKFLDETWSPRFVVIIAQKNHHTRFFLRGRDAPENVPPGTVIDNKVCHPRNNDFYLCAHAGMIGTSRPTHYHVLVDEVGFSADDLQELVHSLSYVYQRSTTAISVVAPICYAHHAATQVGQMLKFGKGSSETSSSRGGATSGGAVSIPQPPKLKNNVCNSMFFC